MSRHGAARLFAISLALGVGGWGCVNDMAAEGNLDPLRVTATSTHCAAPPDRPGAVLLDDAAADHFAVRLGMGQRSTGGYAVRIADEQPERVDDGIAVVRVEWRQPGPDDAVTQALTRPCVEAEVPLRYDGVRFIDAGDVVRGEVWRRDRNGS